jgi:hypothetical protein
MVNIVIFGETGAGKSAVINLMAGRQVARTSPDMERCTLQWEEHTIIFDNGTRYQVFDTVGMEVPQLLSVEEYVAIIANAYSLINVLKERGGISLLLFCVRAGRFTQIIQNNYRLFFEFFCQEKVPLALVLTGLESERHMEDWYTNYRGTFEKYGIHSVGHACITAKISLDGRHKLLYEESRRRVRSLVEAHCNASAEGWTGRQGWREELITSLRDLAAGRPKKTDVVGVLTKRCGMPIKVAQQLAQRIPYEEFLRDKPYLAHGNDRKTTSTPRMIQSGATQPESPTPSYLDVSTLTLHFSPCSHRTIRSMLQTLLRGPEVMTTWRILRVMIHTPIFSR